MKVLSRGGEGADERANVQLVCVWPPGFRDALPGVGMAPRYTREFAGRGAEAPAGYGGRHPCASASLEFAKLPWDDAGAVSACWLFEGLHLGAGIHVAGETLDLCAPPGWTCEGSLSQRYTVVEVDREGERLRFLRQRGRQAPQRVEEAGKSVRSLSHERERVGVVRGLVYGGLLPRVARRPPRRAGSWSKACHPRGELAQRRPSGAGDMQAGDAPVATLWQSRIQVGPSGWRSLTAHFSVLKTPAGQHLIWRCARHNAERRLGTIGPDRKPARGGMTYTGRRRGDSRIDGHHASALASDGPSRRREQSCTLMGP